MVHYIVIKTTTQSWRDGGSLHHDPACPYAVVGLRNGKPVVVVGRYSGQESAHRCCQAWNSFFGDGEHKPLH